MRSQAHSRSREIIVAEAIREVVSELRMVEVADYIAFIRFDHFACVSDIVDSAAELYFMPGTLKLGHGGDAEVSWDRPPEIRLDLELRPRGATVYFTLTLSAESAGVEVNYVAFDDPDADPSANTALLEGALLGARIVKSAPVAASG